MINKKLIYCMMVFTQSVIISSPDEVSFQVKSKALYQNLNNIILPKSLKDNHFILPLLVFLPHCSSFAISTPIFSILQCFTVWVYLESSRSYVDKKLQGFYIDNKSFFSESEKKISEYLQLDKTVGNILASIKNKAAEDMFASIKDRTVREILKDINDFVSTCFKKIDGMKWPFYLSLFLNIVLMIAIYGIYCCKIYYLISFIIIAFYVANLTYILNLGIVSVLLPRALSICLQAFFSLVSPYDLKFAIVSLTIVFIVVLLYLIDTNSSSDTDKQETSISILRTSFSCLCILFYLAIFNAHYICYIISFVMLPIITFEVVKG